MNYKDQNTEADEPAVSAVPDEDVRDQTSSDGSATVEYISKEGYAKLCTELETLKKEERLRIAERLEYAKSLGDLSENAEFDAAKEEQMLNEMRIGELENLLHHATIVEKKSAASAVTIGSCITARSQTDNETETYTIVGSSEEADPLTGCISYESPLGKAFFGHKKGEEVIVSTPRGDVPYVIIEIN